MSAIVATSIGVDEANQNIAHRRGYNPLDPGRLCTLRRSEVCVQEPVFRGSQWPGFGDADMGRFSVHVRPVQERRQPVDAGVVVRRPIAGGTSHLHIAGGAARKARSQTGIIARVPTPGRPIGSEVTGSRGC